MKRAYDVVFFLIGLIFTTWVGYELYKHIQDVIDGLITFQPIILLLLCPPCIATILFAFRLIKRTKCTTPENLKWFTCQ